MTVGMLGSMLLLDLGAVQIDVIFNRTFFFATLQKEVSIFSFSLLPNFGKYIRNSAKILVILSTCQNFDRFILAII
jgi:hypothetical protein